MYYPEYSITKFKVSFLFSINYNIVEASLILYFHTKNVTT